MRNIISIMVFLAIANMTIGQSNNDFDVYWNNSLVVESKTGNFKIKFGGRIQTDLMFIDQSNSLDNLFDAKNGVELRRARIFTSGTLYKNLKFKFQVDFAGGNVVHINAGVSGLVLALFLIHRRGAVSNFVTLELFGEILPETPRLQWVAFLGTHSSLLHGPVGVGRKAAKELLRFFLLLAVLTCSQGTKGLCH